MRVCVCCTGRVCCASIAEVCVSLFKSKSFRMAEGLVVVQTFPPSSSLFFSSFTSFPLDLVACYYATPLPPFFFLNSYYYFLVRVPTGEFRDGVNERKGGKGMSHSIPVNSYANFPWIFALLPILRMTQSVGLALLDHRCHSNEQSKAFPALAVSVKSG